MPKIIRYEFMGNWITFWLLCVLGITAPFAVLYLLNRTVRLDSEVDDPEKFVDEFRAGKLTHRSST